jgi:MoaA/NifB/PqqE/SkfB family radical SAM enzyme
MVERPSNLDALHARRDRRGRPVEALCYAPYTQLSFDPTGAASVCCLSREAPVGNVTTRTLDAIWHGPEVAAFRAAMERDEMPPGCGACRWELEAGNVAKHPLLDFDDTPITPGYAWPTKLEFAISNQCNLACVHCRPGLSSKLEERAGLPPSPRLFGEEFFAQLAPFLEHARELSFLGGEPFLQDECFRIWEMLIERDLRPAVFVTTNGTVWNRRVERVLEALPVDVAVSLDGVTPKTIRAVRVLAQPEIVLRNVQRFREYALRRLGGSVRPDQHLISLNFAMMRRNWTEMADFFLMGEELACRVWVTPVQEPREQSLFSLPPRALIAVHERLQRQSESVLPRLQRNADAWRGIVAVVAGGAASARVRERRAWAMPAAWKALERGDEAAAFEAAGRTERGDSAFLKSLLLRAMLLTRHRRLEEAAGMLHAAAQIDRAAQEVRLRIAEWRFAQGDVAAALDEARLLADDVAQRGATEPWIDREAQKILASAASAPRLAASPPRRE